MQLKIVFIDDEKDLCELYKDYFEADDLEIHTFTSPEEGISFIEKNQVDACFIDYRMPVMSGLECRAKISSDIPCILLTGELDILEQEGFYQVAHKPLNDEVFEKIIEKIKS